MLETVSGCSKTWTKWEVVYSEGKTDNAHLCETEVSMTLKCGSSATPISIPAPPHINHVSAPVAVLDPPAVCPRDIIARLPLPMSFFEATKNPTVIRITSTTSAKPIGLEWMSVTRSNIWTGITRLYSNMRGVPRSVNAHKKTMIDPAK